jgi:hypothetical protein
VYVLFEVYPGHLTTFGKLDWVDTAFSWHQARSILAGNTS